MGEEEVALASSSVLIYNCNSAFFHEVFGTKVDSHELARNESRRKKKSKQKSKHNKSKSTYMKCLSRGGKRSLSSYLNRRIHLWSENCRPEILDFLEQNILVLVLHGLNCLWGLRRFWIAIFFFVITSSDPSGGSIYGRCGDGPAHTIHLADTLSGYRRFLSPAGPGTADCEGVWRSCWRSQVVNQCGDLYSRKMLIDTARTLQPQTQPQAAGTHMYMLSVRREGASGTSLVSEGGRFELVQAVQQAVQHSASPESVLTLHWDNATRDKWAGGTSTSSGRRKTVTGARLVRVDNALSSVRLGLSVDLCPASVAI
jgi:hypothetical protein